MMALLPIQASFGMYASNVSICISYAMHRAIHVAEQIFYPVSALIALGIASGLPTGCFGQRL
eukprot:scaffold186692_cov36-Prasinocladus_malaysianus.AAC.2